MLVTRYLLRNLLTVALFVALTLTIVVWLTQSLKLLELVANSDAPPGLFLKMVFLTLPKFLEIILPLSLMIAVLFTYNKMITDNELIVLRAAGVDQYGLAKPAILLAFVCSLLLMFMSTWLAPKSTEQVQSLRQKIGAQYSAFLLREGIFNTFGSSLTVYLRARDKNGDLLGLMIHDTREEDKPAVTILAKKGRIVMDGETPNIVVFDGMRQQIDTASGTVSKLSFSRYTIEISGFGGTAEARWRDAKERTFLELLSPDMTNTRDRSNRDLFIAEAHHRVVSPWNALSFTLTALTALLLGPFNRRGQSRKVALGAGLVVLLQALNIAFVSMAKKDLMALPLLYINTFLPIVIGFYCLHARGEMQLASSLRRWNAFLNRGAAGGTPT